MTVLRTIATKRSLSKSRATPPARRRNRLLADRGIASRGVSGALYHRICRADSERKQRLRDLASRLLLRRAMSARYRTIASSLVAFCACGSKSHSAAKEFLVASAIDDPKVSLHC